MPGRPLKITPRENILHVRGPPRCFPRHMLHELNDSNFKFYKKVQDDEEVSRELFDRLFERYFARKKTLEK